MPASDIYDLLQEKLLTRLKSNHAKRLLLEIIVWLREGGKSLVEEKLKEKIEVAAAG